MRDPRRSTHWNEATSRKSIIWQCRYIFREGVDRPHITEDGIQLGNEGKVQDIKPDRARAAIIFVAMSRPVWGNDEVPIMHIASLTSHEGGPAGAL